MEEVEELCLLKLPLELIFFIFDRIHNDSWYSTFVVCKQFAAASKQVFVTKLMTKMLSSEWEGKTRWLSFQGKPTGHGFNASDRTVSHFVFTKDGRITGDSINSNFVNLSSLIEGTYDLDNNSFQFDKSFDYDKPTAKYHGRVIRYTGKLSINNEASEVVLTGTTSLTHLEIGVVTRNFIGDNGEFVLTSKINYSLFFDDS